MPDSHKRPKDSPPPSCCPLANATGVRLYCSPVVVFRAKLEVAEHHGDVCASHDQDDEHQHQETENVVVVTHPQRLQDKEHLNENCSIGEDAAHGDGEAAPQEPRLVGDLSKTQREDRQKATTVSQTNAEAPNTKNQARKTQIQARTKHYSTERTNCSISIKNTTRQKSQVS